MKKLARRWPRRQARVEILRTLHGLLFAAAPSHDGVLAAFFSRHLRTARLPDPDNHKPTATLPVTPGGREPRVGSRDTMRLGRNGTILRPARTR